MSAMQDYNPRGRNYAAQAPLLAGLRALLPAGPHVLGVDLSHWNAYTDFKALKAGGIEFVILKATEGAGYVDSCFAARWRQALDAGLIVGSYHFFRSNYDGADQADHHLDTIRPLWEAAQGRILPPALDVETADGVAVSTRVERIRAWAQMARYEFKRAPLVYSSPYLWQTLTGSLSLDCVGWVAHWTSAPAPSWPGGWPAAGRTFWQVGVYPKHAWVPSVPGCTGQVDVNVFLGSLAELRAFVGLTEPSDAEKLAKLWAAHPELQNG